ncbi:MAG: hypothetical protein K8T90_05570 [Planctomycetes bacterium]|nr:hypothetical protein [Planctomycetota bacterium]
MPIDHRLTHRRTRSLAVAVRASVSAVTVTVAVTIAFTLAVTAATGASALAAPQKSTTVQVTRSDADTRLERFPVAPRGRWCAISGTGDLTPGQGGNASGARAVWRLGLLDGALVQATDATAAAASPTCVRATLDGDLVFASRGDLTPGAPGNADGSFEAWVYRSARATAPAAFLQMTSSAEDTFFQTFTDERSRAVLVSKADLTPGSPGNGDGSNEVFTYDVPTGALTQLTATGVPTLPRGVCIGGDCVFVESSADLDPVQSGGLGNADGSVEVFQLQLDGGQARQLTASAGASRFVGRDDFDRYAVVESRADLISGGNLDGSIEVYVVDLRDGNVRQLTRSDADSHFEAFAPRSRLAVVVSGADLAPGGDGDGSQELYVVDASTGSVGRLTRSAGDSALVEIGDDPQRWAVISCTGDLRPDVAGGGTGTPDLYLLRLTPRGRKAVRITAGDAAPHVAGFGPRSLRLAIDTTADLVPGGNADGSREAYLVTPRAKPIVRQVSSSPADTRAAAASRAFPVVVLESRGDLVPGSNTDGSTEVFLHRYRAK